MVPLAWSPRSKEKAPLQPGPRFLPQIIECGRSASFRLPTQCGAREMVPWRQSRGGNRLDFTCIGAAVNLAARLEKLAAKLGRVIDSGYEHPPRRACSMPRATGRPPALLPSGGSVNGKACRFRILDSRVLMVQAAKEP
jgi:hypothetical protein